MRMTMLWTTLDQAIAECNILLACAAKKNASVPKFKKYL